MFARKKDIMENRFEKFTTSILKISRGILKIKSFEMEKYGLKPVHAICIYYLNVNENGMSQAQLIKMCEEDKGLISRALTTLEEKEMVRSSQQRNIKKYNSILTLTNKGKEIAKEINKIIAMIFEEVGKELTTDEKEVFYQCLNKISTNMDIYLKQYEKRETK